MNQIIILFLLLTSWVLAQQTNGTISGKVIDAETKESLAGVNILIQNSAFGSASDENGFFRIENMPPGDYQVSAEFIGYNKQIKTDIIVRPSRVTYVTFELQPAPLEGESIKVYGGYFVEDNVNPSITSFSAEELRRSPGSAGDINRNLTALPSVTSRGESSQDIIVRGGSPVENGFIIDNIPVPTVFHFQTTAGTSNGPIGIINTDLIDNVDFYSGGFSAQYGDKLSSIVNIKYRDPDPGQYDGQLELNFAGFGGAFEGPLTEKSSFMISARRSFLDLIANAINAGGAPRFGDVQLKLNYKPDHNNKFTFLNIFGNSRFKQEQKDAIEEEIPNYIDASSTQNTIGLNWFRIWGKKMWSNTSVSYSYRKLDFEEFATIGKVKEITNSSDESIFSLRNINFWQLKKSVNLEFGFDADRREGTFGFQRFVEDVSPSGEPLTVSFKQGKKVELQRAGVFATFSFKPLHRLSLNLGGRLDYNDLNKDGYFSPRFSTSYKLNKKLSVKGSAGVFYQSLPLFILSQDKSIEKLKDTRAVHYIAGFDWLLTPDTKLTLELFDKQYDNAPQSPAGYAPAGPIYVYDYRGSQLEWGKLTDKGEAHARGIELLLQKKLAKDFYGLVSGSYFRSQYKDFNGKTRSRAYDNRYLISVVGGYKPNNIWEFSVRWSFVGETPYTEIDVAASKAVGYEVLKIDKFNEGRIPAYHSLFFRADRRFTFYQSNIVLFLSLWNAYNRENVKQFTWNPEKEKIVTETQFTLLPIFGVEYEF